MYDVLYQVWKCCILHYPDIAIAINSMENILPHMKILLTYDFDLPFNSKHDFDVLKASPLEICKVVDISMGLIVDERVGGQREVFSIL